MRIRKIVDSCHCRKKKSQKKKNEEIRNDVKGREMKDGKKKTLKSGERS